MRSVGLAFGMLVCVSLAHAQPAVGAGGVVNDGSYSAQGVAPGSIVAIFGTNLATTIPQPETIPLSTTWSDVTSVTFNDIPAGLFFVSAGQINAQLPFNVLPSGQDQRHGEHRGHPHQWIVGPADCDRGAGIARHFHRERNRAWPGSCIRQHHFSCRRARPARFPDLPRPPSRSVPDTP
jgi:hypothetical protein